MDGMVSLLKGRILFKRGPKRFIWNLYPMLLNIGGPSFLIHMMHVPLVKYVGVLSYISIQSINTHSDSIHLVSNVNDLSWLICWNQELSPASGLFFMPVSTFLWRRQVLEWLQCCTLKILTPYEYAGLVAKKLNTRRLVLTYCHFLHLSQAKKYITEGNITKLCAAMPVIDNNGYVVTRRSSLLIPSKGSKWAALMVSNPWSAQNYVELSADYNSSGTYAGNCTSEGQLITFLQMYAQAVDIPYMRPPNASFLSVSSPLTAENALLLLHWIRNLYA